MRVKFLRSFAMLGGLAALSGVGNALAKPVECLIEPKQVVEIKAPVEALIAKVHVDRGDFVKRGQILIELDAGVDQARFQLAKYKANMSGAVKAAQSRAEFSAKKLQRHDELFKQKFVSAHDRDEAETEQRVSDSELRESQDNIRMAQLETVLDKEMLRLKSIASPFDGVVTDRSHHPGEVARMDDQLPIMKLAEIDPLYVEVFLSTSELGRIKKGDEAKITPEPKEIGAFNAKVKVVDPVVDAASGTFGVRLEVSNPDYKIPAGIRCQAEFKSIN